MRQFQALTKARENIDSLLSQEPNVSPPSVSDEENDNCGGTPPFQINKQDKTVFGKTSFGIGDTDTHFPVPLHSIKREKFCTPLKCGDRKNVPIFGHRHQTVRNTFLQAPCETARGNGSGQQVPQVIDISTSPVLKNIVEHQQVSDGVTQSPEKETRSEISESVQSLKNDSEAKKLSSSNDSLQKYATISGSYKGKGKHRFSSVSGTKCFSTKCV